jgi:histidine triad (HIT) family protein
MPTKSTERGTEEKNRCIFCNIANRACVDVLDIEPLNPVVKGHRIVFSSRHSTDFTDDLDVTLRVMLYASELAKNLGGEYNLITSKGKNATQSVFHLHVHLIPRKEGDGIKLPWTNQNPHES